MFFGIGFGQAGLWSIHALLHFAAGVFVVQALLSYFWLKIFRYGPMEWLWRALIYGSAPRFLRVGTPSKTR